LNFFSFVDDQVILKKKKQISIINNQQNIKNSLKYYTEIARSRHNNRFLIEQGPQNKSIIALTEESESGYQTTSVPIVPIRHSNNDVIPPYDYAVTVSQSIYVKFFSIGTITRLICFLDHLGVRRGHGPPISTIL
jgi:hypothetical protein